MIKILLFLPLLNAQKDIETLITSIQSQTLLCDIVCIDSSSTDETIEILKSLDISYETISRIDFNHATTRNLALNHEADFYLFMTQDAIPYNENLVENLLKPFDDEDVVVSYAKQVPHVDADVLEKFARETNYPDVSAIKLKESLKELGIKTFFCSNSCAMYRASYFKEVGGFTEGLIMNEDMEFVARAILKGKKVAYQADAKVWHSHEHGVVDIFKRYFDIGVFFKTTPWIQDEVNKYSSTEATGIEQAKVELTYLLKKSPLSVAKSVLFSFTKFIAYKLGSHYEQIPKSIVKKLSLHKNFHY